MPRPSRRAEIVDTAARLFREKGFASTSLDDIASEVGMWKGSLYHYIDSKDDLLLAVVKDPAERILRDIRRLKTADLPPPEKFRQAMHIHITVLEETFECAAVYLQEIAGRNRSDEFAAMDREYLGMIDSIIQEGMDDGAFSSFVDHRIATLGVIGALNWLTHWYDPRGPLKSAEIADRMSTFFLGGLLSRDTSTSPTNIAPLVM